MTRDATRGAAKPGEILKRDEIYVIAIAFLAATLIAASNVSPNGATAVFGLYAYWVIRLFIEALLFIALRQVIERYLPDQRNFALVTALAFLISLPPFVLAITAFDIVLGYPELGLHAGGAVSGAPVSKFAEFGLELFYLSDNHLAFCLLLSLPRIMMRYLSLPGAGETPAAERPVTPVDDALAAQKHAAGSAILSRIDPPLTGPVLWAEAQEHYVRLTTTDESRMVLQRFSDILQDLPAQAGVQVHRSHWVAFDAVVETFKDGANLRLRLQSGDVVPVSRSYRSATEQALQSNRVSLER